MAMMPLYSTAGWGKVWWTPVVVKIRTEASSIPSLKRKMRRSQTRRQRPRAKALQRRRGRYCRPPEDDVNRPDQL
jgi:hypothetical protein